MRVSSYSPEHVGQHLSRDRQPHLLHPPPQALFLAWRNARSSYCLLTQSLLRKYERELKRLRAELEERSRNLVDKRQLLFVEGERRRAEADKMAAIRALEVNQCVYDFVSHLVSYLSFYAVGTLYGACHVRGPMDVPRKDAASRSDRDWGRARLMVRYS